MQRPKSSHEPSSAKEPIVFVVEDDASMRRAFSNLFESVGLVVELLVRRPKCCKASFPMSPSASLAPSTAVMTTNITRFMMDVGDVMLGRKPVDVAKARPGDAYLAGDRRLRRWLRLGGDMRGDNRL